MFINDIIICLNVMQQARLEYTFVNMEYIIYIMIVFELKKHEKLNKKFDDFLQFGNHLQFLKYATTVHISRCNCHVFNFSNFLFLKLLSEVQLKTFKRISL